MIIYFYFKMNNDLCSFTVFHKKQNKKEFIYKTKLLITFTYHGKVLYFKCFKIVVSAFYRANYIQDS